MKSNKNPFIFALLLIFIFYFACNKSNQWVSEPFIISYDFNDGRIPAWGGSATIENINGQIKFTAIAPIQIKWEKFHSDGDFSFTKGEFEADIKPSKESCSIGLIGHVTPSTTSWGPYVVFRYGKVHYLQPNDQLIETGAAYVPENWYKVRLIFDNNLGEKGRYKVYLSDLLKQDNEIFVGEFDYYSETGELIDLVQYTFVGNTMEQPSTEYFIDNIYLSVE